MHREGLSVLTQSYRALPLGRETGKVDRDEVRHNTYADMKDLSQLKLQPYFVQQERQTNHFRLPSKVDQSTGTEADLLEDLQALLSAKFTLMLQVHKDVILDLLHNDQTHDLHLKKLTHELTELRLQNAKLQLENRTLSEMLTEKIDKN
jgi:hypothetical protein